RRAHGAHPVVGLQRVLALPAWGPDPEPVAAERADHAPVRQEREAAPVALARLYPAHARPARAPRPDRELVVAARDELVAVRREGEMRNRAVMEALGGDTAPVGPDRHLPVLAQRHVLVVVREALERRGGRPDGC